MAIAGQYALEMDARSIPATMLAAVYHGVNDVRTGNCPRTRNRRRKKC